MTNHEESLDQLRFWLHTVSIAAGIVVVAIGVVVIFGWHIDSERVVRVLPEATPMQYNTALCFVLCGSSLLLTIMKAPRWATALGTIAAGVGVLTLFEYVTGGNLGIDELLIEHDFQDDVKHPGRMAPNTAICFVLCGICLAIRPTFASQRPRPLIGVLLASVAMGLGFVALSGYFTNLESAYGWSNMTAMAVHTSIAFVVLTFGLLVLLWSHHINSETRLPGWMPITIAVAALTATVCYWQALAAAGDYPDMGDVDFLATLILIAGILLALTMATVAYLAQKSYSRARQLDRANMSLWEEIETRKEAERALAAHRDNLEIAVAQRTQELELARQEAESANRAKSEFLSHMSHELRTPLNGILGYAQILQHHAGMDDEQRNQLRSIVNCGDHLLSLINDVLDLSKIEAKRVEVDLAPLELSRLVHGVTDIVRKRAEHKGISLNVKIAPDVPPGIVTDGAKLRQMLVNLLGNAVKFTDEGSVRLEVTESPRQTLRLDVIDTGIGMSEDELQEIFDPFKQVEAGKAAGGTGLGLAITRNLANLLGATVSVKSKAGEGSTFTISLPLVEAPPEAWPDSAEGHQSLIGPVALAEGQSCTILIADDRQANRDVLRGMLTPIGFEVRMATDGDEALDQLRADPSIVLALMDIRMPRVSGLQVLEEVRADSQLKDLKVIAVTASVYPEFRQQAIEAGFDDFIGKPLRFDELLSKLQKHLDVEFVSLGAKTETIPADQPGSAGSPDGSLLPTAQREQLLAALQIKNVTAIKGIGQALEADSATAETGKLIQKLARQFAFDQLASLLNEQERDNDVGS